MPWNFQLIADGCGFTEGPAWDGQICSLISDSPRLPSTIAGKAGCSTRSGIPDAGGITVPLDGMAGPSV